MRTKSKRGGGNSGVKLKDAEGKVVRDQYGRAKFKGQPSRGEPRNALRAIQRVRTRKLYLEALAEERREREAGIEIAKLTSA